MLLQGNGPKPRPSQVRGLRAQPPLLAQLGLELALLLYQTTTVLALGLRALQPVKQPLTAHLLRPKLNLELELTVPRLKSAYQE